MTGPAGRPNGEVIIEVRNLDVQERMELRKE